MRNRFTLALLPALLVLGIVGCERPVEPMGPDATAPLHDDVASNKYRLVHGNDGTGTTSAWIDRRGGELKVGPHMLSVSANAVDQPTLFTMTVTDDHFLAVDLTATREEKGKTVDVGAKGFKKPLLLKLDYDAATESVEPDKLNAVWVVEDGGEMKIKQVLKTWVDGNERKIRTHLDHFSIYAVATM